MVAGWWLAYDLSHDPMGNKPVSEDDPERLVRTSAVQSLEAYLASNEAEGGIYLVNGGYGSGKTSTLRALHYLCGTRSNVVVKYYDISSCKNLKRLTDFFKKLGEELEQYLKEGKSPIIGLDQLHNIETKHVEEYFKDKQTAFEALKNRGVALVFAGDERFASLVRTAGPVGAIFDGEFTIPPFEEELTRQLIDCRLQKYSFNEKYINPFRDDAIREIVKLCKGNPRQIIDACRKVMMYSSSLPKPIQINRGEVISATAELSEPRLNTIRALLREAGIPQILTKLGQIHGERGGHAKIHELARLLDAIIEKPSETLEDLCKRLSDIKVKPDELIKAAERMKIVDVSQRRVKGAFGSITEQISTVKPELFQSLVQIREQTGLVPSQFLERVATDSTLKKVKATEDLLLQDLKELEERIASDRSKSFLARSLRQFGALTHPDSPEIEIINVYRSFLSSLSLEFLNVVFSSTQKASDEISQAIFDVQPEGYTASIEKIEELITLYETRGLNWDSSQREMAQNSVRNILKLLIESSLNVLNQNRSPKFEKDIGMALASFREKSHSYLQEQKLIEEITARDHLALLLTLNRNWKPNRIIGEAAPEYLCHLIQILDLATFERATENDRVWHFKPIVGSIHLMSSPNEDRFDEGVRLACHIVSQLAEQAAGIIAGNPYEIKLSAFIRDSIKSENASKLFDQLRRTRLKGIEKAKALEILQSVLSGLRQSKSKEEHSDYSSLIWYLLRNFNMHNHSRLVSQDISEDLMNSFVSFCITSTKSAIQRSSADAKSLLLVTKCFDNQAAVAVSGEEELLILNADAKPGQIMVCSRPEGGPLANRVAFYEKNANWNDIKAAKPDELSSLPPALRSSITEIRKQEISQPRIRERIRLFNATKNKNGKPCALYGTQRAYCIISTSQNQYINEYEVEEWSKTNSAFIGLPFQSNLAGIIHINPLFGPGFNSELSELMECIKKPQSQPQKLTHPNLPELRPRPAQ